MDKSKIPLILVYGFLVGPIVIAILSAFTEANYLSVIQGFSLKWIITFFRSPDWISATKNSLFIASVTMLLTTGLALITGIGMEERSKVYFLTLLPLYVPPMILGLNLLFFAHALGLTGTYWIVIFGHTLYALPIAVMVVRSVLASLNRNLLKSAWDLGASRVRTFYEVTLPLIRPGLISTLFLSFILSFNDFYLAFFLTNNKTRTLPVMIWNSLRQTVKPTVAAASFVMIVLIFVTLVIVHRTVGLERISL